MTVGLLGWLLATVSGAVLLCRHRRARRRDVLLARASHELRGPLQAVMFGLTGLQRVPETGSAVGDRAREIETELRRVVVALGDLDAARTHRRPAVAQPPTEVDLSELLRTQAATWVPLAARQGRELVLRAVAPLVVAGDPDRLAQATGNLIANALEHGRGAIVVSAGAGDGRIRVEVADEGPGLRAPLAQLLGRAATRRDDRGHGLAVAADVARSHGGRLATAPGAPGCRLVLDLPVAARRSAA